MTTAAVVFGIVVLVALGGYGVCRLLRWLIRCILGEVVDDFLRGLGR